MGYGGVVGPGYAAYPALGATLGGAAAFAIPNTTVATAPYGVAPVAGFGAYPVLFAPPISPGGFAAGPYGYLW